MLNVEMQNVKRRPFATERRGKIEQRSRSKKRVRRRSILENLGSNSDSASFLVHVFEKSAIKGDPGWRNNNFEISVRFAAIGGGIPVACDADEEITFAFHVDIHR